VLNGPNIVLSHEGGPIEFFFDARTKNIRTTDDGPVITLPGSLQSELGCSGDWQPDCLATMMFDRNADGVFQYTTDDLPTGSYEVKVAHNRSWDENYGAGGAPGGANITFSATAGKVTTFRYDIKTHVLTVASADPPLAGTGELRAHWIDAGTIAWPADLGSTSADATWELYGSHDASLVVSPEREVTGGGEPISLTRIYAGTEGFAKLIEEFAGGSRVFAVEDFRESYSPAQWSEVRQRLAEAKFRSARVFLQVELSDQMKQYLGASTARAEVPSVILE
jgi:hypothetical protein